MHVQDHHALVTGGTRGIGRAIAAELAGRGARVTLVGRSTESVVAVAKQLGGHGVAADLADPGQIEQLLANATEAHGPVAILINNAGVNAPTPLAHTTAASLQAHVATNLIAPLQLMRAVVPVMLERDAGRIANIGSIAGDLAIPNQVPYCASKAGLASATRALQRELCRTNVRAVLVVLGLVATDMIDELSKDPVAAAMAKRFALLPALEVDAVARHVVDAIESGRPSLVLPRVAAPMHHLRLIPARVVDGMLAGVGAQTPRTKGA